MKVFRGWLWGIGTGFAILILAFLLACSGCSGPVHNPDPTPALANEIEAAGQSVTSADNKLATNPPAVKEARVDLKSATGHIEAAKVKTTEVSVKFNQVEAQRVADEAQIKKLNEAWIGPRLWHFIYWVIGIFLLLGILAAIGNFFPGWWSLPALWFMKAVRFVVFAGIPHLVSFVVGAFKFVKGLFHKEPLPNLTPQ